MKTLYYNIKHGVHSTFMLEIHDTCFQALIHSICGGFNAQDTQKFGKVSQLVCSFPRSDHQLCGDLQPLLTRPHVPARKRITRRNLALYSGAFFVHFM